MKTPLIAITSYRYNNTYGYPYLGLSEAYVKCISRAGGLPMVIPLGISEEYWPTIFKQADGILLTGGGDIHPKFFAGIDHSKVSLVDIERDRLELFIVQEAFRLNVPILGICRGLQVINVALGGSLFEDISDQTDSKIKHDCFPDQPRDYLAHEVMVSSESKLATITCQSKFSVNSMHHQAIRRLADQLTQSACAPDSLIEAVEARNHPFALAVQWHPEAIPGSPVSHALFRSLVLAASNLKQVAKT